MLTRLSFTITLLATFVYADELCSKDGTPEVVDELLTRTRDHLPTSFMLPTRVGIIGIYSANITNLNTFTRSKERNIVCNGNTVQVPIIWFRKPTGRFMVTSKQFNFIRKVHEVTIGILEANLLIEFDPKDDESTVAVLKTLSVTRLSRIEVRAIGFGLIGKIISKITTLIIRFFEMVFQAFMEDNLKNEIENVMVHVPLGNGFFPSFHWNGDTSDEGAEDGEVVPPDQKTKVVDVHETGGLDFPEPPKQSEKRPNIPPVVFTSLQGVQGEMEKEEDDFEIFVTEMKSPVTVKSIDDGYVEENPDNEEMEDWVPSDDVEVFTRKTDTSVEREFPDAQISPGGPWRPPNDSGENDENYDDFPYENIDPRFGHRPRRT